MPLPRGSLRLAILCIATTSSLALTATTSAARTPSFYDPPDPLPTGSNGDVLRHEPSNFYLDPLHGSEAPADAQRMMYRSTNTHGEPTAVTGTVLTPNKPWTGPGKRPVVAYAAGTQGMGDQCAPSKKLDAGENYEGPLINGLLEQGYGVVVTDYEGLGTPGVHTYVNRVDMGHAVLDSLRAAQQLPGTGLPEAGPVATFGYSQGGGASASAAELQPDYAPELNLRGSYAGAVPANLSEVADQLDGNYSAGLLGFALAGIDSAYPELNIPDILNDRGNELLRQVQEECTLDFPKHAFTKSSDLTRDGRPLSDYLQEEPFKSRVEEQTIGRRKPQAPVLSAHSIGDDIVPYAQGKKMAQQWCAQGATVQFNSHPEPTHVAPAITAMPEALNFLQERFAGQEPPNNCAEITDQDRNPQDRNSQDRNPAEAQRS